MGRGARLALALILLWVSFVCFYVAFHPGGVQVPGPNPRKPGDTSQTHAANNPGDIIASVSSRLANPQSASGGDVGGSF